MALIDDVCFNGASEDLWVVVIDVILQILEVLLRLAFEVIVSEHIANLL